MSFAPTEPESRDRGMASSAAARLMTFAYMLMGALAVIGSFIPGLPNSLPEQATGSRVLGLGALALGLAFHWLPWNRWPHRATLVLAFIGFAIISASPSVGGRSAAAYVPYAYAIYFAIVFVWVGLTHPRWTSLAIAPVGAFAYAAPIALAPGYPRIGVSSVWVVMPVCVLVGETIAWAVTALQRTRAELEDLTALLAHDAMHDGLTRLPNRQQLQAHLGGALARAGRSRTEVAVLFIDVDRFKMINDSLGHEVGDLVLIEVGARLRTCVRAGDLVARLGGDEFAVVCESVDAEGALVVASNIHQSLTSPVKVDDDEVYVSASIGVALGAHAGGGSELLRDADVAMYRAKQAGRSRSELFDAALQLEVAERLQTETALRRALEREELRVFYQPIVNLNTGGLLGFEALVRWHKPGAGLISAEKFLPVAEESGLITEVDGWVLRHACHQLARWNAMRLDQAPLSVSVNLSARTLATPGLVAQVIAATTQAGVAPDWVTLELTETALLADPERALAVLEALRARGIRVAVDDFGVGYSSLSYLRKFALSCVKVDREFVAELGTMSANATIMAAVISLGRTLGYEVVAEGVESAEQVAALRQLGCERAQGDYFARPMSLSESDTVVRAACTFPVQQDGLGLDKRASGTGGRSGSTGS